MGMTINLNGNETVPQIETQGLGQAPIEPVECFFSFYLYRDPGKTRGNGTLFKESENNP